MLKLDRQVSKKYGANSVLAPLPARVSLSEIFHENTKLTPLGGRAYGQYINQVAKSTMAQSLFAQPYKIYSLMDQVELKQLDPQSEPERNIVARRQEQKRLVNRTGLDELIYWDKYL